MPFYKRDGQTLMSSDDMISGPGYMVTASTRGDYTFPLDGWRWYETLDAALIGMQPTPSSITKRQALQALILVGKDEAVTQMLASMGGIQGKLARAEWEESNIIERNRPLVISMAGGLGMTNSQLDDLFALGATL